MANYGFRADGSEMKTQWEVVLYHLQSNPGHGITQWQASRDFGFTRLAAIVKDIEKKTGIRLKRKQVQVNTRYGGKTWVMRYWYE